MKEMARFYHRGNGCVRVSWSESCWAVCRSQTAKKTGKQKGNAGKGEKGGKKKIENEPGEVSTEEQAFLCVLTSPLGSGQGAAFQNSAALSGTATRSPNTVKKLLGSDKRVRGLVVEKGRKPCV